MKKLKLSEMKVKSFVTNLEQHKEMMVKAGGTPIKSNPVCPTVGGGCVLNDVPYP